MKSGNILIWCFLKDSSISLSTFKKIMIILVYLKIIVSKGVKIIIKRITIHFEILLQK